MIKRIFTVGYITWFVFFGAAAFITFLILALNFGGVIESPKKATLFTIPSTFLGLVSFVFFIIALISQWDKIHKKAIALLLLLLSILCCISLLGVLGVLSMGAEVTSPTIVSVTPSVSYVKNTKDGGGFFEGGTLAYGLGVGAGPVGVAVEHSSNTTTGTSNTSATVGGGAKIGFIIVVETAVKTGVTTDKIE